MIHEIGAIGPANLTSFVSLKGEKRKEREGKDRLAMLQPTLLPSAKSLPSLPLSTNTVSVEEEREKEEPHDQPRSVSDSITVLEGSCVSS